MPGRDVPAQPGPDAGVSRDDILRLRSVHRAVADLRRGTPVLIVGRRSVAAVPAETVGAGGLGELAAIAAGPAVLVLSATRDAALRGRAEPARTTGPRAVALSPALLMPAALRSLADPTADQLLPEPAMATEPPEEAGAVLSLVKLARLLPAAVVVPVGDDLAAADRLDLLRVSAADIASYPSAIAADLVRVAEAVVPLEDAPEARVVAFRAPDLGIEHLAILVGRPEADAAPLVRMHSECFTGDLLGSLRCDCGPQLRGAIRRMAAEGSGVLLYLAQEGRGIGLVNKLRAYALQDRGLDTVDANRALGWGADERNFMVAAVMLEQLGIHRVRLLTNNPDKVAALVACGVEVASRERHVIAANGVNDRYLSTKAERFGHLL